MTAEDVLDLVGGPALSSLALTYQTVTAIPAPTCGNSDPRYVIDLVSHQAWPARCRRNRCDYCLPINARRRALAMSWMRPERMIRLSLVAPAGAADPLDVARTRVKRTRQALARMGVAPGHWSWTMEVNPAGTGYHAHVLQRGGYIPQDVLQVATTRAGAGQPYINRIRASADRTARYGLKTFGAAGYGLKLFRSSDNAFEALDLNHGRLEHHSPGFFGIDGENAKVREVEKKAVEELYPSADAAYIVVDRKTALYLLSDEGRRYIPRPA